MHMAMSQKILFFTKFQTKKAAPQDRNTRFVRACAIEKNFRVENLKENSRRPGRCPFEMHIYMPKEPFDAEISRKNAAYARYRIE